MGDENMRAMSDDPTRSSEANPLPTSKHFPNGLTDRDRVESLLRGYREMPGYSIVLDALAKALGVARDEGRAEERKRCADLCRTFSKVASHASGTATEHMLGFSAQAYREKAFTAEQLRSHITGEPIDDTVWLMPGKPEGGGG